MPLFRDFAGWIDDSHPRGSSLSVVPRCETPASLGMTGWKECSRAETWFLCRFAVAALRPPAGRNGLLFDLYPAFIPRSALRNSGTHWANLWSRLRRSARFPPQRAKHAPGTTVRQMEKTPLVDGDDWMATLIIVSRDSLDRHGDDSHPRGSSLSVVPRCGTPA